MRGLSRSCTRPRLEKPPTRPTQNVRRLVSHITLRRPNLAASRRSLSFCDAFTILLAPVLCFAFAVDATAKTRHSTAWDRQIAEVQRQIEELQERQQQTWLRIQQRSVSSGAALIQRRMYSSDANSEKTLFDPNRPFHTTDGSSASHYLIDAEQDDLLEDHAVADHPDSSDLLDTSTPDAPLLDSTTAAATIKKRKEFDKLLAHRVAIQMLLTLRTGRVGIRHHGTYEDAATPVQLPITLEQLLRQLDKVMASISRLDITSTPHILNSADRDRVERDQSDAKGQLDCLLSDLRTNQITYKTFVVLFATLVNDVPHGLPLSSYVGMHETLTALRRYPYASITEEAIKDNYHYLDERALKSILVRTIVNSDTRWLMELLKRLTLLGHPSPMRPWVMKKVHGTRIAIPGEARPNSHILALLIRAHARTDQLHRAEAYTHEFLQLDSHKPIGKPGVLAHVAGSFLASLGRARDWARGKKWLVMSIMWAQRIYAAGERDLRNLILRMLTFCVACDNQEAYEAILTAAIETGLKPATMPHVYPDRRPQRTKDVIADWAARSKDVEITPTRGAIRDFQENLLGLARQLFIHTEEERLLSPFLWRDVNQYMRVERSRLGSQQRDNPASQIFATRLLEMENSTSDKPNEEHPPSYPQTSSSTSSTPVEHDISLENSRNHQNHDQKQHGDEGQQHESEHSEEPERIPATASA